MVTAPIMVVLHDAVFQFGSVRKAVERRWPSYMGLAATWSVLVALMSAGTRARTVAFIAEANPLNYALNQCLMLVRYIGLAAWPSSLVLNYGAPPTVSLLQVMPYVAAVALLVIATVLAFVY